jgi:hypothetical protein
MHRRPQLRPLFVALGLVALAVPGCASDDDAGLTVRGTLRGALAGGESAFNFPTETRLFDDRVAPGDGAIAGHCTIRVGRAGEPDTVSIGVSRSGAVAPGDRSLREVAVQIDDPSGPRGVVTATFGASETFAGGPGAGCTVALDYDAEGQYAALTLTRCTLAGTGTDTASLDGELELAGCDVRLP